MFSDGGSSEITRTSSSIFSFNFPPNRSSKASEAKLNHKRDLQEVQLARTSKTGCRQIRRCLRTSKLPSVYVAFGYDDVYRHPVYFQLRQYTRHLPHEFWGRPNRECQDCGSG